jgi:hypothetical protein
MTPEKTRMGNQKWAWVTAGVYTQQMPSKTHTILWLLALLYLLGFAAAVYYRIAISDWLVAHLRL